MSDQLTEAIGTVRELQEWVDVTNRRHCDSVTMDIEVTLKIWGDGECLIAVGDSVVFASDCDDHELSTEFCKQQFRDYAKTLRIFAGEESND